MDLRKLPVEFNEEFTNDYQELVIQLKNISRNMKISGEIIPGISTQNIRFNNVEINSQSIDGSFGLTLKYDLNQKGNIV